MWPAITAVLGAPGTALPRYQKASCQTGSLAGPIGASITFVEVIPPPTTGALIPSDGISNSNGTATGPARKPSPPAVSAAGTARGGTVVGGAGTFTAAPGWGRSAPAAGDA